ncbi:hypothetical protein GW915_04955 [bacterium]|nr:hypothetical protein [bacterium]
MKKSILTALFLVFSAQSHAWTQVAFCDTPGDALGGVILYTDGADLILQISDLSDNPPQELRTSNGDLEQHLNINKELQDLNTHRVAKSYTFASEKTLAFGGVLTNSAVLNIKVGPRNSRNLNSTLAHKGNVYSLYCVDPQF